MLDVNVIDLEPPAKRSRKARPYKRSDLDSRIARKRFDETARGITADLGGEEQLSTVQRHLRDAFAGIALQVSDINVQLMCGHRVDPMAHAAAISVMVRLATRIGLHRVAREVSPTLGDLLRADIEEQRQAKLRKQEQKDAG